MTVAAPERGLSSAEAAERLARHGPNAIPEPAPERLLWRLLRQFQNPLIYLLLVALAVDLGSWALRGAEELPLESITIALILAVNAALGLYQEGRAKQALSRLKALATPAVWVVRDGEPVRRPATEVVPGDLLRLDAGDRVAADGRLEGSVQVDESILTGESVPIDKATGDLLQSGTLVRRGTGCLEVTETGPRSALGRLAGLLATVEADPSPLEKRLDVFGRRIVRWVLVLVALVVAAGVAIEGVGQLGAVLLFAVALAVAAVPEGLPAVLSVTLSLGVERMARRQAVVRRLPAVEALGSVTVVATDKTGTLTENRMEVRRLDSDDPEVTLRCAVLASDAELESGAGDPLELALLRHAVDRGLDVEALRREVPRRSATPFDSDRKYMRVTVEEEARAVSYVKGAPEVLLERSDLPEAERARWRERAEVAAAEGSKVLALAAGEGDTEEGLRLLGLVSLWDPPRPEVPDAVARALSAGIRVIMITGDHPATARAIALQIGLPEGRVVTGEELAGLDEEAVGEVAAEAVVFARLAPEQKLTLVRALQARGEVVAVTGDGVNDAPALKRADVGVVMGQRGSDVAREAGDLILLDDDFATIVAAVEEGRSIYANIQKFIRFLFACNFSEILVVVLGGAGAAILALEGAGGELLLPLTAGQILWINLVMETLTAVALSLDRNPEVMKSPPRDPAEPLLDRPNLSYVLVVGVLLTLVPLGLLVALPHFDVPRLVARTAAFHTLVLTMILTVFPARRLLRVPERNGVVLGVVVLTIGLQAALAFVPALHPFLALTPLPWPLPLVVLGGAAAALAPIGLSVRFLGRRSADAGA